MRRKQPKKENDGLAAVLMQVAIYAVFVVAYYFLVLHFLGHGFKRLFAEHRAVYAGVALLCIVAQGVVLEFLTGSLFRWLLRKGK